MAAERKLWNKDFIITSASYFLFAFSFNLLMPTLPIYLSEVLKVSPPKIGIVLSSYAIALLFVRPFCGFLVDSYERKPLLVIGTLLFVLTYLGYYFAVSVVFFVTLRFVHGAFWGLSTVAANTVAIDIIPASRRAEGIGYFGVNTNIAMAIAPYIAVNIYDQYGFDFLVTSALAMGVLSVLVALFIQTPKRVKSDNVAPISLDRFILVKGIPILFNQLFLTFGWGTLVAFAVLYGKSIGIENSGVFFLFLAAGIILSRVTSGKFVDKGYLEHMMVVALLAITIGFVGFALLHSIFYYCASALLIGIGYGTLFPALQTMYIDMAPAHKRGTANSTYLTGFDLGIGIGMLVGAYLNGKFGFSNMYLFTAALCFISLVIFWFNSRKVFERNKLVKNLI
ncbi:MAG: MFS transporter [Bacteroidetes bacterium]|nr:MFS transporter [Bacteroidota bacterium]